MHPRIPQTTPRLAADFYQQHQQHASGRGDRIGFREVRCVGPTERRQPATRTPGTLAHRRRTWRDHAGPLGVLLMIGLAGAVLGLMIGHAMFVT